MVFHYQDFEESERRRENVPMKTLGEELREQREKMGFSLEEVSNITKIEVRILMAIEEGNFDVLSPPYVRLFLKAYASEIGLDPKAVMNRYNEAMGFTPQRWDLVKEKRTSADSKIVGTAVIFIIIVVAVVALLLGRSKLEIPSVDMPEETNELQSEKPQPIPQAKNMTDSLQSDSLSRASKTDSLTQTLTPVSPTTTQPESLSLVVETNNDAWMKVNSEGKTIYLGTLPKGSKRTWKAKERIELLTGRPEELKLTFQGKPVERIPYAAVVVKAVFTKNGVEVLKVPKPTVSDSTPKTLSRPKTSPNTRTMPGQ